MEMSDTAVEKKGRKLGEKGGGEFSSNLLSLWTYNLAVKDIQEWLAMQK